MKEKKSIHILGIAPYDGLSQIMENVASQYNIHFSVETGDMEESLTYLEEYKNYELDCIISRGETAKLLQCHTNIPVFSIEMITSDVLRAIQLAKNFCQPFAVVGFHTITDFSRQVCELLNYDIPIYSMTHKEELENILLELINRNIRLIIGDMYTTMAAQAFGINSILVTSGIESVRIAFQKAVQLSEYRNESRQKLLFFQNILCQSPFPVCVFDQKAAIIFQSNENLPEELPAFLKQEVSELYTTKEQTLSFILQDTIYKIEGRLYTQQNIKYCVYYIQKNPYTKNSSVLQGVHFYNSLELTSGNLQIYSTIPKWKQILDSSIQMAALNIPILIWGESGTLQNELARYIYLNSAIKNRPLLELDCLKTDSKSWKELLLSDQSPLLDNGFTICFKEINALNNSALMNLLSFIDASALIKRCRVIFTFCTERRLSRSKEPVRTILQSFHCQEIHTPPLRQYSEHLAALIGMYISELNLELSTQVIGFSQSAAALMKQYRWPGNIPQLHRIIRTLVIQQDSYYISEQATRSILDDEETSVFDSPSELSSEYLNGTLDEITSHIIRQILSKEGMTQTKAAKQLQISRSTLWRILKNTKN